ncbi:MAG: 3D domain-containing protein [Candidatus Hydrogenedentes bacterium]|nr:3D domain-containing protein [Candidatus Hydrogenedentota bacterium]
MKRFTISVVLAIAAGMLLTGCISFGGSSAKGWSERTLLVTGYCDCKKCTNWKRNWRGRAVVASGSSKGRHKDIGVTASGTYARRGTIAADTSLYAFGTAMYIPGYGYGRVEDRGSAIKGDHIDLFFITHQQALDWGRQYKRVKIR